MERKDRILLFCSKSSDRISLCHADVVREKRLAEQDQLRRMESVTNT